MKEKMEKTHFYIFYSWLEMFFAGLRIGTPYKYLILGSDWSQWKPQQVSVDLSPLAENFQCVSHVTFEQVT